MKTFHCLPGHLLIAVEPDEARTRSGIWYSERMQKKQSTGLCVQHAQAYLDENLEGKRILFEKWSWREIKFEDTPFYIVSEGSVFAVLYEIHTGWDLGRELEEHPAPIEAEGGQNGNT